LLWGRPGWCGFDEARSRAMIRGSPSLVLGLVLGAGGRMRCVLPHLAREPCARASPSRPSLRSAEGEEWSIVRHDFMLRLGAHGFERNGDTKRLGPHRPCAKGPENVAAVHHHYGSGMCRLYD